MEIVSRLVTENSSLVELGGCSDTNNGLTVNPQLYFHKVKPTVCRAVYIRLKTHMAANSCCPVKRFIYMDAPWYVVH